MEAGYRQLDIFGNFDIIDDYFQEVLREYEISIESRDDPNQVQLSIDKIQQVVETKFGDQFEKNVRDFQTKGFNLDMIESAEYDQMIRNQINFKNLGQQNVFENEKFIDPQIIIIKTNWTGLLPRVPATGSPGRYRENHFSKILSILLGEQLEKALENLRNYCMQGKQKQFSKSIIFKIQESYFKFYFLKIQKLFKKFIQLFNYFRYI